MNQKINSTKIIEKAKTWIGTKFQLFASLKKTDFSDGGCDCFGLISGVFDELDFTKLTLVFEDYRIKKISHINLIQQCQIFLRKEAFFHKDQLKLGSIVCFEVEKNFFHLGIINVFHGNNSSHITFIHSFSKLGYVTESFLDEFWVKKIKFIFYI